MVSRVSRNTALCVARLDKGNNVGNAGDVICGVAALDTELSLRIDAGAAGNRRCEEFSEGLKVAADQGSQNGGDRGPCKWGFELFHENALDCSIFDGGETGVGWDVDRVVFELFEIRVDGFFELSSSQVRSDRTVFGVFHTAGAEAGESSVCIFEKFNFPVEMGRGQKTFWKLGSLKGETNLFL